MRELTNQRKEQTSEKKDTVSENAALGTRV